VFKILARTPNTRVLNHALPAVVQAERRNGTRVQENDVDQL